MGGYIMSIRPIDLQISVQRTQEISRVANSDNSNAENQNSQFAQSFQKATDQEIRQVVNVNKSEDAQITKDGGSKNKQEQERKKRKDGIAANTKQDTKGKGQGLLDIKI